MFGFHTFSATFLDRADAGRVLAHKLQRYAGRPDVVVLAIPRGGVPVAFEVARALEAPLDVYVVRKLGAPGHEELAMGALAPRGVRVVQPEVISALGVSERELDAAEARERAELDWREATYRQGRGPLDVAGRTVLLVDDGLATGSTMIAAVSALRSMQPAAIVVAVPVASRAACHEVGRHADEIVCVAIPHALYAVGASYARFPQTSDEEVVELLRRAARVVPSRERAQR